MNNLNQKEKKRYASRRGTIWEDKGDRRVGQIWLKYIAYVFENVTMRSFILYS
jgi:hypothetical protein